MQDEDRLKAVQVPGLLLDTSVKPGRYRRPEGVAFMEVTPSGYAVYHPADPKKPRYVLGPKSVHQHFDAGMNEQF